MKDKRVEYIDVLRGVTMILVVYSHVAVWGFDQMYMAYNDIFISFRMPVFFFISGWVFYKADRIWTSDTVKQIISKKFMVQIIPFLFFMHLYMIIFHEPEYESSPEYKYGYWFVYTLFQYFVIYIGAEVLFNRRNSNKRELVLMLFFLALSYAAFYYEQIIDVSEPTIYMQVLSVLSFSRIKYIIFFWLGTFVKKNFDSFVRITDNQYAMAACLGIFLFLSMIPNYIEGAGDFFISFVLLGVTGIVILFTFFRKNESYFTKDSRLGKILQFIGRRTLDIYLLHFFLLPYHMNNIGTWLIQNTNKTVELFIILAIAIWVVALSLLLSKIIRLSPFLAHYLFGAKTAPQLEVKGE